MPTIIEFFHPFTPPTATAQQRRHTGRQTFQGDRVKFAAATLRAVFERHAPGRPLEGPVRLSVLWTFPLPAKQAENGFILKATRPDLDNLEKMALDAMTKCGYWKDDAQVADKHTVKFYGPIPGIAVSAMEVDL